MYDPLGESYIRGDRKLERERIAEHQLHLVKFCELTKRALENIDEVDPNRFRRLYDKWFKCFILDYTLHYHKNTAPSIFGALCQAHFVVTYRRINDETARLKELGYFPEDEDLLIRRLLRKDDKTPIWMFTQSQAMDAMLYVSEKLNHVKSHKLARLALKVEALFTRCSVFFCEANLAPEVLDVPDMRTDGHVNANFLRYCCIYFNAIFRRLFYYELIKPMIVEPIDTAAAESKLQAFVEGTVCTFLGEEGVEDLYQAACDDAYRFPGDKQWYQFLYPDFEAITGDVLQQTRPLYAKSFFTENRVSKAPILITNRQMSTTEAHIKMQRGKMPLLIQFCSRFWVYDHKTVWATDGIYCALATWLYILKRRYKGLLLGTTFKRLIDKIWNTA
jgi:hypothetical protein